MVILFQSISTVLGITVHISPAALWENLQGNDTDYTYEPPHHQWCVRLVWY